MAKAKWRQIWIDVPKDLNREQRAKVADLVIEHIVDRTENGKDKDGRRFRKYSKEYVASLDFMNAGKSKNDVNLKLSGDMLASLILLEDKPGKVRIGFEKGSEENAKADGNITGSYGKPSPDPSRARDFLGIQNKKLKDLIDYVRREV